MMSYNIGGGLVGLPFAFLHLGIPISLAIIVFIYALTLVGCEFFFRVKSVVPGNFQTFYELGYMLYGKLSIYFIAFNITMIGLSFAIVDFIVFGDTCVSLMNSIIPKMVSNPINIRATYVILLAVPLTKEILKKDLKELKIVSVILIMGLISFIVLIAEELITKKQTLN